MTKCAGNTQLNGVGNIFQSEIIILYCYNIIGHTHISLYILCSKLIEIIVQIIHILCAEAILT